jgi:hypothetical protein
VAPKNKVEKPSKKAKVEAKAKSEKKPKQKKGDPKQVPEVDPSPILAPAAGSTDFLTPDATQVVPFFYDQRQLDLSLPASFYSEKIEEFGFNRVDVHLPGEPLEEELRRFKGLPEDSRNLLQKLLSQKSSDIQKRMLIALQYIFMAAEFS